MRKEQNFWVYYFFLLIFQIALCNFSPVGPYISLTLLPAMVLCMPLTVGSIGCMLIAFASGLAVDWMSEGLIGINAASLVPIAFARKGIIRLFFEEDLITRKDRFSFNRYGVAKVSAALVSVTAIFLLVYILLDVAGTRPQWFIWASFGASLLCNWPLALLVARILTPDDRKTSR